MSFGCPACRLSLPRVEAMAFLLLSGTPMYHLPPVKAPTGTKKKSSKHCFFCGKKTGLATSYECRYYILELFFPPNLLWYLNGVFLFSRSASFRAHCVCVKCHQVKLFVGTNLQQALSLIAVPHDIPPSGCQ